MPARGPRLAWLMVLGFLAGCAGEEVRWLHAERVEPARDGEAPPVIAINQSITVYFDEPIDPVTVTRESFRVLDPHGHSVPGSIEVGTRSVRFVPIAPITADLSDGSFRLGATYRLEVPGMPTSYAIRSRSGRTLERGVVRSFRVLRHARELGLPTAFLPIDVGTDPLRLDLAAGGLPRMAADRGVIDLQFSHPLLPPSVRCDAFRLWWLAPGQGEPVELPLVAASVVAAPPPAARYRGSTVRLELAPNALAALAEDDVRRLFLELVDGEAAVKDYRGRPVQLPVPVAVHVDPGDRIRVRDVDLSELRLKKVAGAQVGFELRAGRLAARAFVEAGSGVAGALVAGASTVLAPGRTYDRGDGTLQPAAGVGLEFASLDVPPGAELRLRADATGLVLRVCGDATIRGRLVLEGTGRQLPWRSGDEPPLDALVGLAGALIVAGGDFVVGPGAEIVVAEPGQQPFPLVVVAGGDVLSEGSIPPGCAFALREGARIAGVAERAVRWRVQLTPGAPPGTVLDAAAWSDWIPLPATATSIMMAVSDPQHAVDVAVQVAPPHVIAADRPLVDDDLLTPPLPLPLVQPLAVEPGAFCRIRLSGRVRGSVVPSIGGVSIHER